MNTSLLVTIESKKYPGFFLRVSHGPMDFSSQHGFGALTAGHGKGLSDQFRLTRPVGSGDYITTIDSVSMPGYCVRMDGSQVKQYNPQGSGTVNLNTSAFDYEQFCVRHNNDGTVSFEARNFPNVFMRLQADEKGIVVN